jgi:iron complex transport system substrate-binding protein
MPGKKFIKHISGILLILSLMTACAAPAPVVDLPPTPTTEPTPTTITLQDGRGQTITLPGPAQRIVSIAPSHTEILFAVGAGSQVVGRDMFSDYPPEAQQVTDLGGGFGALDMETLVSLQPDLVLASDINAPEQITSLENLGLTVFVLSNPLTLEEMYTLLITAGALSGHSAEAESLVSSLQARVEAVDARVSGVEERPLVFYELDGGDPNAPWTAGANTFIDKLIERAGGQNLGSMLDQPWAQLSLEALIEQDPEVIILGDFTWGGVTPEAVKARAGWSALQAVQTDQVYTFDDNLVSRPGPRMVAGLEEMAKLLHPELFP